VQNDSGRQSDPGNSLMPDLRPSYWQDEGARIVMERLGRGNPLFGAVVRELLPLRDYGVPITPEMVERAIDKVEGRERHQRQVRAIQVAVRTANPRKVRPAGTAGAGRFAEVKVNEPVVYYMRIGDRIKIGYSSSLRKRLESINPEELLAVEAGGMRREAERHAQFGHLRTHGEWFRYEGALVEHIESLRQTE
jgi:hypothetical protein